MQRLVSFTTALLSALWVIPARGYQRVRSAFARRRPIVRPKTERVILHLDTGPGGCGAGFTLTNDPGGPLPFVIAVLADFAGERIEDDDWCHSRCCFVNPPGCWETSCLDALTSALPAMSRTALAALGDPYAAEDAVQDTVLQLLRRASLDREFTLDGKPVPFFVRATRLTATAAQRSAGRRQERERKAARPEWVFEEDDGSNFESRHIVCGAFQALPATYREALSLVNLERLSYSDAANRLGIEESTLRGRLNVGKRKLRALLKQQPPP